MSLFKVEINHCLSAKFSITIVSRGASSAFVHFNICKTPSYTIRKKVNLQMVPIIRDHKREISSAH